MRGNRATRMSGLVKAWCFFPFEAWGGRDGLFLSLRPFTRPFPFIYPRLPHPTLPPSFRSFSFPHNSVPPKLGSSCVSLLICPVCVLSVTL